MMKKDTLAKLLAEEDIFVVHKQTPTAYFDVKRRELGLPIWKDEEMTNNIYDLMVCHEIAHALWTPLEMMEEVITRKLNKGVVNILEDARIEKMVQKKYPGSVGIFNRGYAELGEKNFFDVEGEDISKLTVIDRINLFFKKQKGVTFSDEEKVFVKKTNELETTEDVLALAEEIYKWMEENAVEDEDEKSVSEDGEDNAGDAGETEESSGGSSEDGDGETEASDEKSKGEGEEDGDTDNDATGGNTGDDAKEDAKTDSGEGEVNSDIGGTESTGGGKVPVKTDTDSNNAIDKLRDATAENRIYGRIATPPKDLVVTYKTCLEELGSRYNGKSDELFYRSTFEEVAELKAASKKTVAYMVKEFEMKKSADQYARAAVAKTGTLDMGALHTYKFNDDLFKKVTTLPGATNHGMVMVLDWSGSMAENLIGTLSQLYNLVWFCRRTQIPFKVLAFSDVYSGRRMYDAPIEKTVEYGEIQYQAFNLLEFFSSDMSGDEENRMMHYLWMVASRWTYRDWAEKGYPIEVPNNYSLGGTPLNDAIMAMTTIVPKFKMDTGVQKVNTIFLTDGASNRGNYIRDYDMSREHDISTPLWNPRSKTIVTNPKNNKTYEMTGNTTNGLLRILKDSVDGMNLVGFFIAGRGRTGRIDKYTIARELGIASRSEEMKSILKKVNKDKYLAVEGDVTGYDEYYLLQGGRNLEVENDSLDDELVGASKAKLKSAFGKMSKGKVESRTLLNRFVKLVA